MDLDGDGFLDLVTTNDGDIVGGRGSSRREHLFMNNGQGRFSDMTDVLWPAADNIGEDDNMVSFLDQPRARVQFPGLVRPPKSRQRQPFLLRGQ